MPALSLAEAEALVADALQRCRTAPENARDVAHALVLAEADGLKSHGLLRVPIYAAQAKIGKVDGFATPSVERPRPALVAIDAKHGFAYPAMNRAVALLPSLAREFGIAAAGIRRSHHVGVAGHQVERLAQIPPPKPHPSWTRKARRRAPASSSSPSIQPRSAMRCRASPNWRNPSKNSKGPGCPARGGRRREKRRKARGCGFRMRCWR